MPMIGADLAGAGRAAPADVAPADAVEVGGDVLDDAVAVGGAVGGDLSDAADGRRTLAIRN